MFPAGASGPSNPESPSASTGSSTSLAGHPSNETDSDTELFFTPKSEPDSDSDSDEKQAWWNMVADENEKAEWTKIIVSAFNERLDRFNCRALYAKIPELNLIDFFQLNHPGCTKGRLRYVYHNVSDPWDTTNAIYPRLLVFLGKYKRNIEH